MDFKRIIEKLTKTTNVGFYMIHLNRAVERLPLIQKFEESLQIKLNIFEAADGYQLVKDGHPTTCQQRGPPATRGAGCIGCTVSHINICKDALSKNYDYIVIFEDDCEFKSDLHILDSYINEFINLQQSWDLFLLGYNPISVNPISNTNFSKINRFDCTHACILNTTFMTKLINTYTEYVSNNTTLSIDTMYSNVIESYNLNAYGFRLNTSFFIQTSGLYSYVVERVR